MHSKLLIFLLAPAILIGCGQKDENEGEEVKSPNEQFTTKQDKPKEKQLPADFPADIPMYRAAKILMVTKDEKGENVTFELPDKIPVVAAYYNPLLKAAGYVPQGDIDALVNEKSTILTYKKDNKTYDFMYHYMLERQVTHLVIAIR